MKNIIMLSFFLGFWGMISAQIITIKDIESNQPIEGASIISHSLKIFKTTNAKGQADISAFKDAKEIEIRIFGYETIVRSYKELWDADFEVMLEVSNLNLDAVVVSATRWRQNSSNVPSKIVPITQREVNLQNPQTAADLLGISGKVYIQKSQQGGGSPMIRGFATNRLLYTVDGVRMNNAIFRGGNIQNVINLDPLAIENAEVLFGPGSVIYGSDAIGGVMSFQTLTPQFSLSDRTQTTGKAAMRYSSANQEKNAHFDINTGWKKWALVTSISSWDFDHLRQGSHGPDDYLKPFYVQRQDSMDRVITQEDPLLQIPSGYSQLNLMQKVRLQPNENWDFQYGLHYSETSSYGRYDRHNRLRNGLPRYGEWDYGPQKWMMNHFNIAHSGRTGVYDQMNLRLAVQNFDESRISRNFNQAEREIRAENVKAYSANLDFTKTLGTRNTLFYGLEYVLNDVTSTGLDENVETGKIQPGAARYPQASWISAAIYLHDEFRLSEKMTLETGLRYNQFALDARFDTTFYPFPFTTANINSGALTGSFGGVYRSAKSLVISANFGTAFRSPNVDDVGKVFDSEPGAVVVPNPDLKAEYAYNFDLSVVKIFKEMIKVDLTGYYTILQNALVRRDFQLNERDSIMYDGELSRVQAIQNAARANVYGIQAGIEIKLSDGFSISSDINYQLGKEEMDDGTISPSRHAAPLFGRTSLNYHANKLDLQFNVIYQGERKADDLAIEERAKDEIYAKDESGNNYAPAWYTLNFKAMYPLSDFLIVSTGLENITDQRYRPYSSGISGAGRNFVLAVRVNF